MITKISTSGQDQDFNRTTLNTEYVPERKNEKHRKSTSTVVRWSIMENSKPTQAETQQETEVDIGRARCEREAQENYRDPPMRDQKMKPISSKTTDANSATLKYDQRYTASLRRRRTIKLIDTERHQAERIRPAQNKTV